MTAHVLRITDGTTTKTFTSGDSMTLIKYEPRISLNGEDIEETAEIRLASATPATNTGNYQAIERLFLQARNYAKTETGKRVYVEFDPGATGTARRSMITNGGIKLNDEVLATRQYDQSIAATISWTRQPFWEGALAQIPLTNASATDDTAGIAITNANDATAENWVSIKAAGVSGDLPAPIKLQMYNSKSGADASDEIFVFHNVYSTPASLDHIYEGEDATGAGITDTGDATDSGDFYASIAWTATTETLLATWALSSAELDYMAGGRFKILARWHAAFPYTNVWLRLKLESANSVLLNGELTPVTKDQRGLHIIDTMRLPPYLAGQANLKGINLKLYALRNTAGTHTIALDYLMLGAISGDNGWKRFVSVDQGAAGVAYQEYFTHDMTEGFTYRTDTSADIIAEFSEYGGDIMLVPATVQKLYFLTSDYNGLAKVDQTWTIKLWYRPRWNAI